MVADRVKDILIVDPDHVAHIACARDGVPELWRAFLQLGENYTTVCDDLQLFLVIRLFGHVVEQSGKTRFLYIAAVLWRHSASERGGIRTDCQDMAGIDRCS